MKGPFPILSRGHSGSRLLCEAFLHNGFWMGKLSDKTKDSKEFAMDDPEVYDLLRAAFQYPSMDPGQKEQVQAAMARLVKKIEKHCPEPENYLAFGWKRGLSLFTIEIFLDTFPQGKVVHLIRDGRDVMLSRLDGRMSRLDDEVNQLMIFGRAPVREFCGQPLTAETADRLRNEIEMQHWLTAVRFGMRGRKYPDRYLEVFYEDLCTHPVQELKKIMDFLGLPLRPEAEQWIQAHASPARIGKWRQNPAGLEAAIAIGEPLLRELGYLA